ncbi:amidohydrolase family protein [Alphaproteobacteria bacterium]|nr:amidohydrolase family protein [bacterium]MDC0147380.1 amidohydrolase family protein [Alphaproteobacteria bacterium]
MFDLVIRNAFLVDGTGAPARTADIAIQDGVIRAVGSISASGKTEIDAKGDLVTPGWVDIHTHYDGQVTWDPYLTPSGWNGVTTVVMGNCGVGFAPAKADKRDWLIGLMEGVEDIPGAALAEGITWEWETFPEYLDALDKQPRALDVATQIPHGSVRAYVMGDRGANNEAATPQDIAEMADIVEDSIRAGALGFSTSRTMLHLSKDGVPVPGTFAGKDELLGIAHAMQRGGHGVFEMASDLNPAEEEFGWMAEVSKQTGLPVTYALLQNPVDKEGWRELLKMTDDAVADGAKIKAQIAMRPTGLILGWESTVHPFSMHPEYQALEGLPIDQRVAKLRQPEIRQALLDGQPYFVTQSKQAPESPEAEDDAIPSGLGIAALIALGFDNMFELMQDGVPDYEPKGENSVAALAQQRGVAPAEIVYDMLMENDGKGYVYLPLLNYAHQNFDHIDTMFHNPNTVLSLSDGGAHCGVISDASFPTYLLSYWVRDRARGARWKLEEAVAAQTSKTAALYGLLDRGVIAPGMKADLNVIDFEGLQLKEPEMVHDLPAGGRRLIQHVSGYRYTIVSGVVTYDGGKPTGKMPGKLVRGPQTATTERLAAE